MELWMIRHFQTPGNVKKQYIGRTDEELDETRIPDRIPEYPEADQLFVSPMKRCVQTAEILFPGQKQSTCELLREMDFGEYEQKTYEELKGEAAYQSWLDSGGMTAFPGGESRQEFQDRCVQGMTELVDLCISAGDQKVAAVVHGGTIMAVMDVLGPKEKSFYDWQVKNGEGYQIEIEEEEWKKGVHSFWVKSQLPLDIVG